MTDLPDRPVLRWTHDRKAAVVASWRASGPGGRVRLLEDYGLTTEEVESWVRRHDAFGPRGLMQTHVSNYGFP